MLPLSRQFWRLMVTTIGVIGLVTGCAHLDSSQLDLAQSGWIDTLRRFGEWSTLWLCSVAGVWIFFRLPQVDLGWISPEVGWHHRDRSFGLLERWETQPIPGDAEKANALATYWAIAYLIGAAYIPWASTLQLPLVVKNLLIPTALAILLAWLLWKIANSNAPASKALKQLWRALMILSLVNWLVWLIV